MNTILWIVGTVAALVILACVAAIGYYLWLNAVLIKEDEHD